jgi:cytochrome c553
MRPLVFVLSTLSLLSGAGQSMACEMYDKGLGQAWPEGPREFWYGASQGSRLMLDSWYRALPRADNGTAFAGRESLSAYGFEFCDDASPDPIGFVLDSDPLRAPAVGLTCAACHSGVLTDGINRFTVHAGSADMDLQSFVTDLFAATKKVWAGPFDKAETSPVWQGFAGKVLGADASPEARKTLHDEVSAWLQYRKDIQASVEEGGNWGHGRQDAVQVILNTVATLSDSKIKDGLPASSAPVSIPHVWLAPHSGRVQWNGSAYKSKDVGIAGSISSGAMIRNISEVIGVFAEVRLPDYEALARGDNLTIESSVRLGNLIKLERAMGKVTPPVWPNVWGAVDRASADYKAGAALYDTHCAACHSRIDRSLPFDEILDATGLPLVNDPLNGAPFVRVINAFDIPGDPGPAVGTDPMMVCNSMTHASWSGKMTAFTNVFAALQSYALNGVSGIKVERFPVGTETLRLIEDMSIRILWDKQDEITAIQKNDLSRQSESFFAWFTGAAVPVEGGDWVIAQAEEVPTPTPVTHHLTDLDEVRKICTQQLAVQRLTAPDTTPPGYKAGPLAGIFATAPFLHNGSVPTLDALLLPPAERPTRFVVGDVAFDPATIGLGAPLTGGRWSEFSVTDAKGKVIAGNSNAGHAYPAQPLTQTERQQLLTYLKGL